MQNVEKATKENRMDVGMFNSVEPGKPLTVPKLNQLIWYRVVVYEYSIPKSGSGP